MCYKVNVVTYIVIVTCKVNGIRSDVAVAVLYV